VESLVGAGLLAREGEEVLPTPAALRFHAIRPLDPPRQV
jgi:hypothetical protein